MPAAATYGASLTSKAVGQLPADANASAGVANRSGRMR